MAGGVRRPGRAEALEPDDRRRDRRDRRPNDPCRRPVARRLRLVQLPRLRPRSRDHRLDPGLPGEVGHAPELVAPARQPGALRADRGAPDRAARLRGLARAADDHAHPHVGHPGARRRRHDLHGQPRAQDDLRRLPVRRRARRDAQAVPVRGSGRPRAAAGRGSLRPPAGLHGRREQHDRQRPRPARVRARRAPARRAALRRRRARLRRHRRALAAAARALRQPRQQHRAPRRRDVREHRARRRLLEGVLVARGVHRLPDGAQGDAEDGRAAVPLLRPVARRLARDDARRLRRERAPRRRAARWRSTSAPAASSRPRPAGRAHAEPLRLPDHRDPARRPPTTSARSVGSCSTTAST